MEKQLETQSSESGVCSTLKVCKNSNSAAPNKIFRLEPKVVGMEQSENEMLDAAAKKKKKKKNIREYEKRELRHMIPNLRTAGYECPEPRRSIKKMKKACETMTPIVIDGIIPPYNIEAREAEMAYPLDKIIHIVEWNFLKDILEIVQGGSELSPEVYPRFVCNRVHKVQNAKDESSRRRIAGILSYITHLIRFKEQHSFDHVESASAMDHTLPSIFYQKFCSMFADFVGVPINEEVPELGMETKKIVCGEELNLLIKYVVVLSLFVDDFHSDPADIAKDLRMHPLTVRNHFERKFVHENELMVATLPVPLEFPPIVPRKIIYVSNLASINSTNNME